MSWGRPYGWGCRWERKPSYCARFSEDGTKACRNCPHLLEKDKDKWFKFFDEYDASLLKAKKDEVQKLA